MSSSMSFRPTHVQQYPWQQPLRGQEVGSPSAWFMLLSGLIWPSRTLNGIQFSCEHLQRRSFRGECLLIALGAEHFPFPCAMRLASLFFPMRTSAVSFLLLAGFCGTASQAIVNNNTGECRTFAPAPVASWPRSRSRSSPMDIFRIGGDFPSLFGLQRALGTGITYLCFSYETPVLHSRPAPPAAPDMELLTWLTTSLWLRGPSRRGFEVRILRERRRPYFLAVHLNEIYSVDIEGAESRAWRDSGSRGRAKYHVALINSMKLSKHASPQRFKI
ncbi:hypothetical protein DFH09DRAFT_1089123 [Mycena vulgaris]|nr:hypothetical protein DFH09DRAFT_1089123 [Mycena vulgaris]